MRACIFTSKPGHLLVCLLAAAFFTSFASWTDVAHADDQPDQQNQQQPPDRTVQPDEDDYSQTPFTKYGEFNSEQDEIENTRFLEYGRLFGVSLGAGFESATGNRGSLWQGGFPLIDFKVHYWFDFNFAMDLSIMSAPHRYSVSAPASAVDQFDVTMNRLGFDLKYYFDTKNLSAAFSFANPYVLGGIAAFSKSEHSNSLNQTATDNKIGFTAGLGLEFPIKVRKTYFYLEGRLDAVTFQDTYTSALSDPSSVPNLPDLSGLFYTLAGGLLFTW